MARFAHTLASLTRSLISFGSLAQHDLGTMLEAAVFKVSESPEGEEAVLELATWLLARHRQEDEKAFSPIAAVNYKGELLELGGKILTDRLGGLDNDPKFKAVATLGGVEATGEGRSKKKAEQQAAAFVLEKFEKFK